MRNLIKNTEKNRKKIVGKLIVWSLLVTVIVQTLSVGGFAFPAVDLLTEGGSSSSGGSSGGSAGSVIEDEKIKAELKQDYLKYIKKDLLMKIEDYELKGDVDVVITFSENSIIETYLASSDQKNKTFDEYRASESAIKHEKMLIQNQDAVIARLFEEGLISEVYHTYTNILDGAFVRTTYEQLDALCDLNDVERVTLSDTYNPMVAVENPVNVYDTGIFNSGNVSYTGKGTLVAVLDTGCDYTHTAFTTHTVQSPKYSRDDIEAKLPLLRANEYGEPLEVREVYYGNITGGKIVYGYDYADKDTDIMPYSSSHGTHVAGIIGGKDDTITGVAIDTQFAIMKVFSDYRNGARDGDIIAALEDSVVLSVDAINMSLGTSCGFTIERDSDNLYKNELYERIENAGISLIVAASNDHSSAYGGENGNTNKTENPDSATVGSPSTYSAAMSVASINGNKDYYMLANGDQTIFFTESFNLAAKEYDFFEMLGIKEGERVTYEYVTVPGLGLAVNYTGLDLNGKIALVKRGDISFEEKVQFAQEAGAIAVIIYNNVVGDIVMTIGNNAKIPAVSIGKDAGDILSSQPTGTIEFDRSNVAGPFMSDFSSWGPAPDLTLKPDITAHGGNILSAVIGGYDEQSGTSMAAPNMCGITVLIRQYVKDKFSPNGELSTVEIRDLVNQLCMSTATIALDKNGNPYSPRKQGAGIADIVKSTTTEAYLYVDGLNKTKLELGADPNRTGVYTMKIKLANLSTSNAVSYKIGYIAMTESVSSSDPEYVAEMAYILSPTAEYTVNGGTFENGIVTVGAGQTAEITAKLTLSDADKAYLNSMFENGMYVEGFLTFENTDGDGVDLNAPFLAFYGDWGEAPIFDIDFYEVETEAHNNAIDDEDKIKADYYATTPLATYYYDYIIPLGAYLFEVDESEYSPIPATREHAAISYYEESLSGIYGTFAGLLRNAKELRVTMVNTTTGEVIYDETEYNCYKAHYNGAPMAYSSRINKKTADFDNNEFLGWNNHKFEVTLTATLDWDGGKNVSDTYSYSFYIDYEAPTVTSYEFITEYDKSREENRYYLEMMVYDNHYAMACQPVTVYELFYDEYQETRRTLSSLSGNPIPIYQENIGEETKVRIEVTDYLDIIADSDMPSGISINILDYALNSSIVYIPFPYTDDENIEFLDDTMELPIYGTADLTKYIVKKDTAELIESDFLRNLRWESSDESVVTVKNGKIEALKTGEAVIRISSDSWTVKTLNGKNELTGELDVGKTRVYKSIRIVVNDQVLEDNPESGQNIAIDGLTFSYYKTLFAFNNHIDYSAIGKTDSINYFGGKYSIEFYPSEKIQLFPQLEPWNLAEDRYEFIWSSSNPKVATVDQDGIVTAEAEGKARITLQIKIDGKTSLLAARLSVEVKSEFIIENRTLVAYKGKGGDVVIPDDEGIITIGAYAFSHFYLDNEMYVEKDENGYYDIDLKKRAIGNDTITSVVIPEGVETVEKYAFYNCSALVKVTLPESCETISTAAFNNCKLLENVNFENVNIIYDMAFMGCESLSCEETGGADLSGVYTIGEYAFSGTALKEAKLPYLSRVGGGIFSGCKMLTKVELGQRTRVSNKMFENTPIKEIVIYSDVVADNAFIGCTELESVVFKNDMTYIGESAFKDCTKLSSVTFEGSVEKIASLAFNGCRSLEAIDLPNCKIVLGDSVFGDSGIKRIVFGNKTEIASIGISLFEKLSGVDADISASELYKLAGNAIYTKDGKELVLVLPDRSVSSITVPASVEKIGDGAFSSATSITTVKFENGSNLKAIGNSAFANCTFLVSIELPSNPIEIGERAFHYATSLKNIDLSNVTSIGLGAFGYSALNKVNLTSDNVVISSNAFYECSQLREVVIGKNAKIGDYAFYRIPIMTVELEGDAEIGDFAFAECTSLQIFDFEDVTNPIGNYAFAGCVRLGEITAPKITEIGEGSFANCIRLSKIEAPELKIIGDKAFTALGESNSISSANYLTSISLPKVESIGDYAFCASVYLETAYLPMLSEMGESAFLACEKLRNITYSDELTVIPGYVFYACFALEDIDFDNIVEIGDYALCGVKLTSELDLPSVEKIGIAAFATYIGVDDQGNQANVIYNDVEVLNAPLLKIIDDYAFSSCQALKVLNTPSVEEIGEMAFFATAIEAFPVSDSLRRVEYNSFDASENFAAFFAYDENGQIVYDVKFKNVLLDEGVLYTINDTYGYTVTSYPVAKQDKEYVVLEGTFRVDFGAFMSNTYIEKVTLPMSMRAIGNFAFYGCESLRTVVFNSYYAPVLEGSLNGSVIDLNPETVGSFTAYDELYQYDYYLLAEGYSDSWRRPFYYRNFVGTIGTDEIKNEITAIVPDNCEKYDSLLYRVYFTVSDETLGVTMGKYAIAFIDAVNKLPENIDRFDKQLMDEAIVAFNTLESRADEKTFVAEEYFTRFNEARTAYNVDLVTSKIDHIFDVYNNKHSFDKVKDARNAYNALSDTEKALITNADVLEQKIADLTAIVGQEIDFTLNYEDYFPETTDPGESGDNNDPNATETQPDGNTGDNSRGKFTYLIIVISAVAAVAVVAASVAVVILLKKKKGASENVKAEESEEPSSNADETAEATENEEVSDNEEK